MAFQKSKGITADGIAGKDTLPRLVALVQQGARNEAVRGAQYLLSKFETLDTDGSFGPGCLTAVKNFQSKMDISVDGSVGPTTWQYLFGYNVYPGGGGGGTVSGNVYASVCSGTSTLTSAQMYANAKYVLKYLVNKGFSKNAACGILGNFYAESKINPGIWEGGHLDSPRGGYGLAQWTSTNYNTTKIPSPYLVYAHDIGLISSSTACKELDTLAKSNPKKLMDGELDWLIESMQPGKGYFFYSSSYNHTSYKDMTFNKFKTSTLSADTLATIFHDYYERSADSASEIQSNRSTPAKNYYNTGSFT